MADDECMAGKLVIIGSSGGLLNPSRAFSHLRSHKGINRKECLSKCVE